MRTIAAFLFHYAACVPCAFICNITQRFAPCFCQYVSYTCGDLSGEC